MAMAGQRSGPPLIHSVAVGGRRRLMEAVREIAPDAFPDAPKWFFYLFVISILVRDGLSPFVMNLFTDYISMARTGGSSGAILSKIHPGSYGILIAGTIAMIQVLPRTRIKGNPLALGAIFLSATIVLLIVLAMVRGNTSNLGYLIDSILVAPLSLFAMARLSVKQRLQVVWAVLILFLVNSGVVLAEFVSRQHILPYPQDEVSFRPTGLFGHPLMVGMLNACIIPSLFVFSLSPFVRWSLVLIFSMTVVLAQARVATVIVAVLFPILLVQFFREGLRTGRLSPVTVFAAALFCIATVPLVILAAIEVGALDRVLAGFVDDSSQSRVVVYNLFNYMTPSEFMFGMSIAKADYYARFALGLNAIESPIVVYVVQFGVIGAAVFMSAMLFFYASIAMRAPLYSKLAVFAFVIAAASNNSLASKGPSPVTATVLTFVAATVGASRRIREELQASAQGNSAQFIRQREVQQIR